MVTGWAPASSAMRDVRAHLQALHVGNRGDWLVGIDPLRRPRHRVQNAHPLFREAILECLARRLPELGRIAIARCQERDRVRAEDRVFVGIRGDQDLADLRLLGLHRALDLVGLEQRRVGVDRDLDLAARRLVDVGDELHDVLGMEVGRWIGGRHVPFCLRGGAGGNAKAERHRGGVDQFHFRFSDVSAGRFACRRRRDAARRERRLCTTVGQRTANRPPPL